MLIQPIGFSPQQGRTGRSTTVRTTTAAPYLAMRRSMTIRTTSTAPSPATRHSTTVRTTTAPYLETRLSTTVRITTAPSPATRLSMTIHTTTTAPSPATRISTTVRITTALSMETRRFLCQPHLRRLMVTTTGFTAASLSLTKKASTVPQFLESYNAMRIYLKDNKLYQNKVLYRTIDNNSANYNSLASWNGLNGNLTTVGTNGRSSYYGTYDQSGLVSEITNNAGVSSNSCIIRGGEWRFSILSSSIRGSRSTLSASNRLGFRISSLSNPMNIPNFAFIGDINNNNDITGYGSVSYNYMITKYPITNCEYIEFLNSVAKIDTNYLYDLRMTSDSIGGINRGGNSGNYSYFAKSNMFNKPVVYITWFSAARYCNWLHNGKPVGDQNINTTENGTYNMSYSSSFDVIPINNNANYWISTENEWYKAAYYKGGTNSGYWTYATQSDIDPIPVTANELGDGILNGNSANVTDYICQYNNISNNMIEVFARWS